MYDGYLECAYNIYLSLNMKDLEQDRWFRHESEWRLVEEESSVPWCMHVMQQYKLGIQKEQNICIVNN